MNKRDVKTIVVLLIIFSLIAIIILIYQKNYVDVEGNTEFNSLTLLKDENNFLSVSNNVNKICEYSTNNSNNLKYISDVNYNEYKNTTFKADKIYVISRLNLYKYYISGNLYENIYDMPNKLLKEKYFILNYDMDTSAFFVEEIDKETYNNAENINHEFKSIEKNSYNKFEYTTLSDKSRAVLYFNDFLDKLYTNINEAYLLIDDNTKTNNFDTLEKFKDFVNKYSNITMKEFSVNGSKIGIKDNYNNEYIINITYVLKYNVTINIKE